MAQSNCATQQYSSEQFVESCGAILFDLSTPNEAKVCLVNLVKTQQWMLAKGRRNIGESRKDAATREVTEETGYKCKLLPIRMLTRAPHPEDDQSDTPDRSRGVDNLTDPFMFTIRELPRGKGVKVIWWFIAVLEDDARAARGPGEDQFKPEFFSFIDAVDKLHFETDRQVLRKAIQIVDKMLHCQ